MASKDARRNACVENQQWIPMQYIDNMSMNRYLEKICVGKHSVYGFSGQSRVGTLRIDSNRFSNANLIGDFFVWLDNFKDESVDIFIVDPLFECYNPSRAVWMSLVKKGLMPESSIETKYFAHPHLWQKEVFKKVKKGGLMISKRNIANTNVLTEFPQMFYVKDSRPMAHIVRIDHK